MEEVKVIEVHESVFSEKEKMADENRQMLRRQGTFLVNLMASPGAGKTTLLLKTIAALKEEMKIGVMEADIDATVDAQKIREAGAWTIQIHTGGNCAMDSGMTQTALRESDTSGLDLLLLENVGNLVCPAEEDVGAAKRAVLLSVPEGDDKPLKYPLMFQVADVVLLTKTDTMEYFDFDLEKARENIRLRNPEAEILPVCAKTGEGMEAWYSWLRRNAAEWKRTDL